MTEQRYTPGPWQVDEFPLDISNACDCLTEDEGTEREWIGICTPRDENGDYEHIAYCHPDNAPVVAAALDILAALKLAADALTPPRNSEEADTLERIHAAIIKATAPNQVKGRV